MGKSKVQLKLFCGAIELDPTWLYPIMRKQGAPVGSCPDSSAAVRFRTTPAWSIYMLRNIRLDRFRELCKKESHRWVYKGDSVPDGSMRTEYGEVRHELPNSGTATATYRR